MGRHNRRIDRGRRERKKQTIVRSLKTGTLLIAVAIGSYQAVRLANGRGWLDLFRIRDVRVVGAKVANPSVLVAEAGLMGKELHFWSPLAEYAVWAQRDPLVAEARFRRDFPNRLVLEIVEREPIVFLALTRLTPVDSTGQVLPVSAFQADWDVPVMVGDWDPEQVVNNGMVEDEIVREMLSWLAQVGITYPALAREISSIELTSEGTVTLQLVNAQGSVLLSVGTPLSKLGLVDDVLRDLREKGMSYTQLDLRFGDQIVVRRG